MDDDEDSDSDGSFLSGMLKKRQPRPQGQQRRKPQIRAGGSGGGGGGDSDDGSDSSNDSRDSSSSSDRETGEDFDYCHDSDEERNPGGQGGPEQEEDLDSEEVVDPDFAIQIAELEDYQRKLFSSKLEPYRLDGPASNLLDSPFLKKVGVMVNISVPAMICRFCHKYVSEKNPLRHMNDSHNKCWRVNFSLAEVKDVTEERVLEAAEYVLGRALTNNDVRRKFPPYTSAATDTVLHLRHRYASDPLPEGVEGCVVEEGLRCLICPSTGPISCNDIFTEPSGFYKHCRKIHGREGKEDDMAPCSYQSLVKKSFDGGLYRVQVQAPLAVEEIELVGSQQDTLRGVLEECNAQFGTANPQHDDIRLFNFVHAELKLRLITEKLDIHAVHKVAGLPGECPEELGGFDELWERLVAKTVKDFVAYANEKAWNCNDNLALAIGGNPEQKLGWEAPRFKGVSATALTKYTSICIRVVLFIIRYCKANIGDERAEEFGNELPAPSPELTQAADNLLATIDPASETVNQAPVFDALAMLLGTFYNRHYGPTVEVIHQLEMLLLCSLCYSNGRFRDAKNIKSHCWPFVQLHRYTVHYTMARLDVDSTGTLTHEWGESECLALPQGCYSGEDLLQFCRSYPGENGWSTPLFNFILTIRTAETLSRRDMKEAEILLEDNPAIGQDATTILIQGGPRLTVGQVKLAMQKSVLRTDAAFEDLLKEAPVLRDSYEELLSEAQAAWESTDGLADFPIKEYDYHAKALGYSVVSEKRNNTKAIQLTRDRINSALAVNMKLHQPDSPDTRALMDSFVKKVDTLTELFLVQLNSTNNHGRLTEILSQTICNTLSAKRSTFWFKFVLGQVPGWSKTIRHTGSKRFVMRFFLPKTSIQALTYMSFLKPMYTYVCRRLATTPEMRSQIDSSLFYAHRGLPVLGKAELDAYRRRIQRHLRANYGVEITSRQVRQVQVMVYRRMLGVKMDQVLFSIFGDDESDDEGAVHGWEEETQGAIAAIARERGFGALQRDHNVGTEERVYGAVRNRDPPIGSETTVLNQLLYMSRYWKWAGLMAKHVVIPGTEVAMSSAPVAPPAMGLATRRGSSVRGAATSTNGSTSSGPGGRSNCSAYSGTTTVEVVDELTKAVDRRLLIGQAPLVLRVEAMANALEKNHGILGEASHGGESLVGTSALGLYHEKLEVLRGYLGPNAAFRSHAHYEALNEILAMKKDVLLTLPTGHGKTSLLLATAFHEQDRVTRCLTVYIAPFDALIQQVAEEGRRNGLRVTHWTMEAERRPNALEELSGLLIVSADMAFQAGFQRRLERLNARGLVTRVCLDEAHLFAIDALQYRHELSKIKYSRSLDSVPVVLLSGTVPDFLLDRLRSVTRTGFGRPIQPAVVDNPLMAYEVRSHPTDPTGMLQVLKEVTLKLLVVNPAERTPVGVGTRAETRRGIVFVPDLASLTTYMEGVKEPLESGGCRVYGYHSKLSPAEKAETLAGFRSATGGPAWLIATTAASSGLDFRMVLVVIHAQYSYNLVQFLQEVGRAGREGGHRLLSLIVTNEGALEGLKSMVKKSEELISGLLTPEDKSNFLRLGKDMDDYIMEGLKGECGGDAVCLRVFLHKLGYLPGHVLPCLLRPQGENCEPCSVCSNKKGGELANKLDRLSTFSPTLLVPGRDQSRGGPGPVPHSIDTRGGGGGGGNGSGSSPRPRPSLSLGTDVSGRGVGGGRYKVVPPYKPNLLNAPIRSSFLPSVSVGRSSNDRASTGGTGGGGGGGVSRGHSPSMGLSIGGGGGGGGPTRTLPLPQPNRPVAGSTGGISALIGTGLSSFTSGGGSSQNQASTSALDLVTQANMAVSAEEQNVISEFCHNYRDFRAECGKACAAHLVKEVTRIQHQTNACKHFTKRCLRCLGSHSVSKCPIEGKALTEHFLRGMGKSQATNQHGLNFCLACFVGDISLYGISFHDPGRIGTGFDPDTRCPFSELESCKYFCLFLYHDKWDDVVRLFKHRPDFKGVMERAGNVNGVQLRPGLLDFAVWLGSPYIPHLPISNGAMLFYCHHKVFRGVLPFNGLQGEEWDKLKNLGLH